MDLQCGLVGGEGGGGQDRWIRVEVDPRVIKGPTFAQSTAPGTIFHDTGKIIFGRHDLVGAVEIFVKITGAAPTICEIRIVLAHV